MRHGHHSAPATAEVVRSTGRGHAPAPAPVGPRSDRTTAAAGPMTPPPTTTTPPPA
ncbi:hypothetical protein [Streptomyces sp. ID05-04B]|uniref:hypothetical protein n=1 Tax=Streptomyces sp. ID05-04B TaxID=3028661 RepID=UPI0039F69E79